MSRANEAMSMPLRLGALLGALLLLAGLSGCETPLKKIETLGELKSGQAIVVGRVELVPPLRPEEQRLPDPGALTKHTEKNTYFLLVGKEMAVVPESNPLSTKRDGILKEEFGKTFYMGNAQRPVYLITLFVQMEVSRQRIERVWLPGGLVVDIQPGDRAVYMGTVRYHRNEFFDIEKVELDDEFRAEEQAFRAKFGNSVKLVKRLARPVKS